MWYSVLYLAKKAEPLIQDPFAINVLEKCCYFREAVSFSRVKLHSSGLGLSPSLVSLWINESSADCEHSPKAKLCFQVQQQDPFATDGGNSERSNRGLRSEGLQRSKLTAWMSSFYIRYAEVCKMEPILATCVYLELSLKKRIPADALLLRPWASLGCVCEWRSSQINHKSQKSSHLSRTNIFATKNGRYFGLNSAQWTPQQTHQVGFVLS